MTVCPKISKLKFIGRYFPMIYRERYFATTVKSAFGNSLLQESYATCHYSKVGPLNRRRYPQSCRGPKIQGTRLKSYGFHGLYRQSCGFPSPISPDRLRICICFVVTQNQMVECKPLQNKIVGVNENINKSPKGESLQ